MIVQIKDHYTIKVVNYFKSIERYIGDFLKNTRNDNPFYGSDYIKANCQTQKYLILNSLIECELNMIRTTELYSIHYVDKNTLAMEETKILRVLLNNNISIYIDIEKDLYFSDDRRYNTRSDMQMLENIVLYSLKVFCINEDKTPVLAELLNIEVLKNASDVYTDLYGFSLYGNFKEYLLKVGGDVLYKINSELFVKANSLNFIVYQVGKKLDENGQPGQVSIDDIMNNAGDPDYEFNATSIGYYSSYKSFMDYLAGLDDLDINEFKVFEELSNVSNTSLDNFVSKIANNINSKTPVEILNIANLGVYTSEFNDNYSYYTLKKNDKDLGFVRTVEQIADTVLTDILLTSFSKNTPMGDIIKVLKGI